MDKVQKQFYILFPVNKSEFPRHLLYVLRSASRLAAIVCALAYKIDGQIAE
jgi:hypothetical protein